jgi:hypothetical protein
MAAIVVSADGKRIAVGGILNDGNGNGNAGHVRIYDYDVGAEPQWKQVGKDIDGEANSDSSGRSVAMSADGKQISISINYTRLVVGSSSSDIAKQQPLGTFANLALGCLADWAHLPITMPIDCLSTAIQTKTNNSKNQNAMALLMTILKEGNMDKGIQAYYVLCFKPALQYTIFEQVKAAILKSRNNAKSLPAAESFLLGMVARTIAMVTVFRPFVRAKVVMQSRKQTTTTTMTNGDQNESRQNDNHSDLSVFDLLGETCRTGGVAALYQGIGPELTRGVFSATLMLMIKEKMNGVVKNALYGRST